MKRFLLTFFLIVTMIAHIQILHAAQAQHTVPTPADSANDASPAKVNLNTASAAELMRVKGINATLARAILMYRNKHVAFHELKDLRQVRGFKKMKLEKWQDVIEHLTV